MQNPTASCTYCGRQRDCMLHMRAEHPPTAAKAWLKRTCKHEEKPCDFGYRAGIDTEGSFHGIQSSAATIAENPAAPDSKGSINLRIDAKARQLIDEAAAILGKTRTEFMIESARLQAVDVLLDQRLFALDAARYEAFMHALDHALDNPTAPGPKLRALLRRVPAWQK